PVELLCPAHRSLWCRMVESNTTLAEVVLYKVEVARADHVVSGKVGAVIVSRFSQLRSEGNSQDVKVEGAYQVFVIGVSRPHQPYVQVSVLCSGKDSCATVGQVLRTFDTPVIRAASQPCHAY